jgi:hypothetical protein
VPTSPGGATTSTARIHSCRKAAKANITFAAKANITFRD